MKMILFGCKLESWKWKVVESQGIVGIIRLKVIYLQINFNFELSIL